ncbi:MAG: 23S rRNA (adenine(2503)-C(2))-methyltransferase RlmN [Bacilli bacterium]|nr:23S rRNA (adenine(2503)-C(2))-methyltransferase RlmN [Bacilli bacterium]
MINIYSYERSDFEEYFVRNNLAKYRATQVVEALYRSKVKSIDEITNLNKDVKKMLSNDFSFSTLEIEKVQVASDETTKFLYRLSDGNFIETVLMKQSYGYSVCVTSQVGCNMGCAFCASGMVKKIRNLEPFEMVLQVLYIDNYLEEKGLRVSHVVVMGIGEPFDNYDNVLKFINIINDQKGLAIGARHITISTCGLVPKILEFSNYPLQVNLAISLHFATDEKRSKYMPINKKYPIKELISACIEYYKKTNRRLTFEYILLDGVNDTLDDAKELVKLLRHLNAYVNLIPYNKTDSGLTRSKESSRDVFFDYLIKNHINAIVRKEHGTDIDAACGQLRVKTMKEKKE